MTPRGRSRAVLAAAAAITALLATSSAAAQVYQQVTLRATARVKTWVSEPQQTSTTYMHLYAGPSTHELWQSFVTRCGAYYAGYGLSASVSIPGCLSSRSGGTGPIHMHYVSFGKPTNLRVQLTDSPGD